MKWILILIISFSSYAFFWNSKPKVIDPLALKTEQERMDWLKKNDKSLYIQILNKRKPSPSHDKVWAEYQEEVKELYDPNTEQIEKERRIQEMKDAMKKKMKANEEKLKQGYRLVNGKLISKEEQEKLKNNKKKKEIETKRVIDFYKEMKMELPKNVDKVDIKDE